jgi:lipid II:glycine glycyltransferase (peptidoglycan interpeptide bridge formation enzyme)
MLADLEARAIAQVTGDVRLTVCHDAAGARPWDEFVASCAGAHYEQTSGWGKVKHLYGWKPAWVWVARDTSILGGAMILTRRIGPLATVGYVSRGPVWSPSDADSIRMALDAVCQLARFMRLAYLVILPPYAGEDLIPLLRAKGFRRKPDRLPPVVTTSTATLLIDLTLDLDAILGGMSMTKRQNIRRGLRQSAVKVRTGDAADVETFRMLMWQSCQRRGISPAPPQADFFANLWRILGSSGAVKFFIAEIAGEAVSGACTLGSSDRLQLWRVGWSGKYDDHDPNDVLHWEVIKWAKESGYREFDFAHIVPNHAQALIRGDRVEGSYSGVTNFKTGFGGELRLLPEPYYRAFHPVVDLALSLGGARVVESVSFGSAIEKISNRLPW